MTLFPNLPVLDEIKHTVHLAAYIVVVSAVADAANTDFLHSKLRSVVDPDYASRSPEELALQPSLAA